MGHSKVDFVFQQSHNKGYNNVISYNQKQNSSFLLATEKPQ